MKKHNFVRNYGKKKEFKREKMVKAKGRRKKKMETQIRPKVRDK